MGCCFGLNWRRSGRKKARKCFRIPGSGKAVRGRGMEERKEEEMMRVLLVGVDTGQDPDFEHSMDELEDLAEAAGKKAAGRIVQHMEAVNNSLYVGAGKASEIREYAERHGVEEVIFNDTLSPSQIRNLGQELDLPVMDRTNLILDIFAIRARTREAKLQVETARLQYMLPRLVGLRENLSRQGGTGGSMSNKGAGETKLELDRRRIEHRISELRRELEGVSRERETMRKKRNRSGLPQAALVGYTNAGKSTLMNQMVSRCGEGEEKTVLVKNMLFATLDTSVRYIHTGDNRPFLLADTVGFIHKLPHGLIEAFRSTLEEVRYADLLIQVVDFSDGNYRQQMEVTNETLRELGAGDIPRIIVYNKADLCGMQDIPRRKGEQIYLSASQGIGIKELAGLIKENVYAYRRETTFFFPYDKGSAMSYFMENTTVLDQEYREDGIRLRVSCSEGDVRKYADYCLW